MTYITMQDLRKRGWNDRLVKNFLGAPDESSSSEMQKPGRPQRLYLLSRVVEVETTQPKFAIEQQRKNTFALRAKHSMTSKYDLLKESIDGLDIPALTVPYDQLLADARENISVIGHAAPVERVALGILLDSMKSLDAALNLYEWHSGVREARILLKKKILTHIVQHYPQLDQVASTELALVEGRG